MGKKKKAVSPESMLARAEKSKANPGDFTMFWLTAVFSEKSESFSTEAVEGDKVRRELIRMAEDLIKSKVKSEDKATEGTLVLWNLERKLAEDLYGLIGDQEDFANWRQPLWPCGRGNFPAGKWQ